MSTVENAGSSKMKVLRCVDWLKDQNSLNTKRLSQQNKNDIQFIIQTNAARKKFLQSVPEDATVPAGVGEREEEPKNVPLHRLRLDRLQMDCQWASCRWRFGNYELLQKHVHMHTSDLHAIDTDGSVEYVCLWDVCGHKSSDFPEMVRHVNYHAYHAHLLAVGFNGRATLKLGRCDKDSTKRNQLPPLKSEHCCMWTGCEEKFNAIQSLFNHVKLHIKYLDEEFLCSWAGCGMTFTRRVFVTMHVRSHTGERMIACYHCGQHFACNRKLVDHIRRQNPSGSYACSVCGVWCGTEYLLREHARQHVSMYACTLCHMSAPTPATLATHVRYRHLAHAARHHACPRCEYRAISKSDLKKHLPIHTKKRKRGKTLETTEAEDSEDQDLSDEELSEVEKQSKPARKYACHMCPEKSMKVFSRGSRLTTHLVQVHGAQWPFGHSRFRYQISEDGMYRLTTTRYEILEVSKKIVDGYSGPKESLETSYDYDLRQVAEPTESTPRRFEVFCRGEEDKQREKKMKIEPKVEENIVEITVCNVDEDGNIISTAVIDNSDVVIHSDKV
ncbi:unnamed protein product [Chilo suppressalis]|uniref:C2H2-type domain-containing protein n=1 Tax=Chilo suppressalis TaxID=168631 RepID=A0ABN8AU85_CHISP|nr:unnamed protein product [Chilo suppressalis]